MTNVAYAASYASQSTKKSTVLKLLLGDLAAIFTSVFALNDYLDYLLGVYVVDTTYNTIKLALILS